MVIDLGFELKGWNIKKAIEMGDIDICKVLARKVRPSEEILEYAIQTGRLNIIEYLVEEYLKDIKSKETLTYNQSEKKMKLYLQLLEHYMLDDLVNH